MTITPYLEAQLTNRHDHSISRYARKLAGAAGVRRNRKRRANKNLRASVKAALRGHRVTFRMGNKSA